MITQGSIIQNLWCLRCKFKTVIADAGYGSKENYDYLEEKGIIGTVKYTSYEKEAVIYRRFVTSGTAP